MARIELRRWLVRLGALSIGRMSSDEAAGFVEAMEPMLAQRFPPGAFTEASLEEVAAGCKFLPSYGELVALLTPWWQQHRPLPPLVGYEPPPERPEPSAEERARVTWLAAEARRVIAQVAEAKRSSAQPEEARRQPARMTQEQLVAAGFRRDR